MDFIIFYEHINRELENVILVNHELERRGYKVKISHFSGLSYGRYVLFSKPVVIVTPWLRTNENVYRFTRFKSRDHKLVNLQWEQIYSKKVLNSELAIIKDQALEAFHICWGENSRKRLIEQGVHPKNIKVTGGIHMDFCRKEFKDYYKNKADIGMEFNLDSSIPWILYISSFSYATYDSESIRILERDFKTSLSDIVNNAKESKILTLNWIDKLLSKKRNIIFIYRPHPSENIDDSLLNLSKKYPNFEIISKYSIKQWINVSDRINTWFSTSIGEIYFLNKKCQIIRPIPIPEDIEVEIMRNATFITDEKTFIEFNSSTEHEIQFPIEEDVIKSFYDQDEEIPSYKRVADVLEDIYLNHDGKKYTFLDHEEFLFRRKYRRQIIISLFIELIAFFGIRLSRILPFNNKILNNLEKWIDYKVKYKETEQQILSFVREKA